MFFKTLKRKFSSKTQKNSPIGSAKASASMVGRLFAVATMNCLREKFIEVSTKFGLLGTIL
jgi:hypothetical protein